MSTFALVHGAWHRGTCWEPTAALLRSAGHTVVAPDLPCEDPAAGLEEYTASVVDAISEVHPAGDIVLVGHSLAGLTIPLVAERLPVSELVYLCALVALPGSSVFDDLYAIEDTFPPTMLEAMNHFDRHDDGTTSVPTQLAIDTMYHDCEPAAAVAAANDLRRQASGVLTQPSPLRSYPDVPAHAIVCRDDRILNAEACARHAAERFDAKVTWLDGGHSPMLAQPAALVDVLLGR